jgi:hypothetical protein
MWITRVLGVAEFRYEKLEGRGGRGELGAGRERITVCCENGESYINSAIPEFYGRKFSSDRSIGNFT